MNIIYEGRLAPRNGGEADLENIERFLRHSAGFQTVYVYVDLTRANTLKIMDHVSKSPDIGTLFACDYTVEKGYVCIVT